jgi:hypothetical protein
MCLHESKLRGALVVTCDYCVCGCAGFMQARLQLTETELTRLSACSVIVGQNASKPEELWG